MSLHDVTRNIPGVFQPTHMARNRLLPQAGQFARIARAYNAIASRQKKLILCKSQCLTALQDAPEASGFAWPFYFRTSEASTQLEIYLGLASSNLDLDVPVVSVTIQRVGAPGTFTKSFSFNRRSTGISIGPGDIARKGIRIDGLLPNTEYTGILRYTEGARIVFATVYETMKRVADDSISVITNPTEFVNGGPIKARHFVDLNTAAVKLWRHSAAHIFSWTSNYSVAPIYNPTVATTGYGPLFGAGGPKAMLNLLRRGTLSRPNAIPARMAVYAVMSGGTQDVGFRIRADSGQTADFTAEVQGFDPGTPGWPWVAGDITLPGVQSPWTLELDTGGRAVTVCGWSIFQWEA